MKSYPILRLVCGIFLVLFPALTTMLNPTQPVIASTQLTFANSRWTSPIKIDGVATSEWNGAPSITFEHGVIRFQNDMNYLYVLIDVIGDTSNNDSSNGWPCESADASEVGIDVNRDNQVTSKMDVEFAWWCNPSRLNKYFPSLPNYAELIVNAQSKGAKGFGPSALSNTNHRIWEYAFDYREIGAHPGKLIRIGFRVHSTYPGFFDMIPSANFFDYSNLLDLTLASPPSCIDLNTPLYYQGWPSTQDGQRGKAVWENDAYGHPIDNPDGDTTDTIGRWGCNMVSHTMAIQYFLQKNDSYRKTDPREMNNWLRKNNGYSTENYPITDTMTEYAKSLGVTYISVVGGRNDDRLESHLCSGNPAVLRVRFANGNTHFVLATGVTTVGGIRTFRINDPIWGRGNSTISQWYNNAYDQVYYLTQTEISRSQIIGIMHSPAHLIVTDPLGRKSGYDPRTDTTFDEIPEAWYGAESIGSIDGQVLPEMKALYISLPLDGDYMFEVIGYDEGAYRLEVETVQSGGQSAISEFTGIAHLNSNDAFTVVYETIEHKVYVPSIQK